MTDKHYNEIKPIIEGIAKRCSYKVFSRSYDDIVQDLWIKILEKELVEDRELDRSLVAKICFDSIVDMIRYDSKRNYSEIDSISSYNDDDDVVVVKLVSKYNNPEDEVINSMTINDFYNILSSQVEDKRRVRLFLEFWEEATGYRNHDLSITKTKNQEGYTESALANLLGYPGTSSSAFKTFRSKMRNLIKEYLNDES